MVQDVGDVASDALIKRRRWRKLDGFGCGSAHGNGFLGRDNTSFKGRVWADRLV